MATLTTNPTTTRNGFLIIQLCTNNPQTFIFTQGTGETWIKIRLVDGATVLATLKARPFDTSETCKFDVSPFLQSIRTLSDFTDNSRGITGFQFTGGVASSFSLEYQSDVVTSWTAIGEAKYIAISSAQPLGNANKGTLAEYVPLLSGSPRQLDFGGAFLTRFERPILWYYTDKASPASASDVSVWQPCLAVPIFNDGDRLVLRLIRAKWYSGATLIATQETAETAGPDEVLLVPIPLAETYVWQANSLVIDLGTATGSPATMDEACIAPLTFDIKQACNNPCAIKWLNTLGGFEVWVFEGRAPRTLTVESEYGQYGVRVDAIATATTTRNTYAREAVPSIELFADQLTLNQVKALQEILYSPVVRLFVGELTAGTAFDDWQTVVVNEGDFTSYDTYDRKYKMSLSIGLPEIYHIDN